MKSRYILFSLIIFLSCTDDKDVSSMYPTVQATVSNITTSGITVTETGSNNHNLAIIDRGILWKDYPSTPNFPSAEYKSFGAGDGSMSFSGDLNSNLAANKKYNIRSYVVANGIFVFSDVVSFTSLGSTGPIITDFTPKSAKVGQTVTITGTGFSNQNPSNTLKLNSTIVFSASNTETQLTFQVPAGLSGTQFSLSVTCAGKTFIAPSQFTLLP